MSNPKSLDPVDDDPVTFALLAVGLAVAIVLLSEIIVPYPPPETDYTLATLGVYLGALLLGPVWAALGLVGYLAAYALDLGFFSPESTTGMEVLMSPFAGYRLSYPLAAGVVGWVVHRGVYPRPLHRLSIRSMVGALVLGVCLIYPVGSVWLGLSSPFPVVGTALVGGVAYLPGEAAKALVALLLGTGGSYALARYRARDEATESTAAQ